VLRLAVVILCVAAPGVAAAQQPSDDAAIRARLAAYVEARNARDAYAEALCYTTDGDFRSSNGPFVSGREAIEAQLAVDNPRYRFALEVTGLRFLGDDVAVVDADVRAGIGENLASLVGTYVMAKQGGDWLIAAARIARNPVQR